MKPIKHISIVIVGIIFISASFLKAQDIINPGPNFWTVPDAGMYFGGYDLPQIPADFFGPGSDPFEGQVYLEGGALDPLPFPDFDVLIERTTTGNVPPPYPAGASIDVEMIELKLVSTEPITVTYSGGTTTEEWHVEVGLSVSPYPTGNMDVIKEYPDGGVFSYMPLKVQPLFTFTLTTNPSEKRTFDTGLESILPLEYYSGVNDYPWEHSPIGDDLNPTADYPLPMSTESMECTLDLLPYLLRQDNFWVKVTPDGQVMAGGGTGVPPAIWYYYPNTDWWNIWFYDHPFDPVRYKEINIIFDLGKLDPELPSEFLMVVNWSSQWWSQIDPPPFGPPVPPLYPEEEELYVYRSDTLIYLDNDEFPVTPQFFSLDPYFIYEYNPEWVSIDIRGFNFEIPIYEDPPAPPVMSGTITHECILPEDPIDAEYGDAPEHAPNIAYIDGTNGNFPTCIDNDWYFIRHGWPSTLFFGPMADAESDGNHGNCPNWWQNQYDLDECFQDGDAGLIKPMSFTITSDGAGDHYTPCPQGQADTILQEPCQTAVWGQDINIHVSTAGGGPAIVNVLFDWNHDGQWKGSSDCSGTPAPEHVLINFPIPANFNGPLSALGPPNFLVGPDEGYFWARFSIMEQPVPVDWDGHGQFADGETEDYLLYVQKQADKIPLGNWPIIIAVGLIALVTILAIKRRLASA